MVYLQRYIIILPDEHLQLLYADAEVAVCEFVWDVEAKAPKLVPLQDDGVEEAQAVGKPLRITITK